MNHPYTPPEADLSENSGFEKTYDPKIFSMTGRLGRMRYIVYQTLVSWAYLAVAAAVVSVFVLLFGPSGDKSTGMMMAVGFLVLLLYIPLIGIAFVFAKRRLHDLNQTGWMSVLLLVPFVNLVMYLYLMFAPGVKGSNNYGPAPAENQKWVKIGAWVLVALTVLSLAFLPQQMRMMDQMMDKSMENKLPDNAETPVKADTTLPRNEVPAPVVAPPASDVSPATVPVSEPAGGEVPPPNDMGGGGSPEPVPQPR